MSNNDSMWLPFAQELVVRIVSGTYPEGSLIPTEAQLGSEFGVSRTVVREGTKIVAEKGLLHSRRGLGTRVLDRSRWRSFDPDVLAARLEHGDRDVVLREVLVLRRCIEPELAARAADLAGPQDLVEFAELWEKLEAAQRDINAYALLDEQFHARVATLGRNSLLQDVMKFLTHPVAIQRQLTNRIPEGTQASHPQHAAVYRAIVAGDVEGARAAMLEHITWAEDHLDRLLTSQDNGQAAATPAGRPS